MALILNKLTIGWPVFVKRIPALVKSFMIWAGIDGSPVSILISGDCGSGSRTSNSASISVGYWYSGRGDSSIGLSIAIGSCSIAGSWCEALILCCINSSACISNGLAHDTHSCLVQNGKQSAASQPSGLS